MQIDSEYLDISHVLSQADCRLKVYYFDTYTLMFKKAVYELENEEENVLDIKGRLDRPNKRKAEFKINHMNYFWDISSFFYYGQLETSYNFSCFIQTPCLNHSKKRIYAMEEVDLCQEFCFDQEELYFLTAKEDAYCFKDNKSNYIAEYIQELLCESKGYILPVNEKILKGVYNLNPTSVIDMTENPLKLQKYDLEDHSKVEIFEDIQFYGKFTQGIDYVIYKSVTPSLLLMLDLLELNRAYLRFEYGTQYVPIWAGIKDNIFYLWVYRMGSQSKISYVDKNMTKAQAIKQLKSMENVAVVDYKSSSINSKSDSMCYFAVDAIQQKVKLKHVFDLKGYEYVDIQTFLDGNYYYQETAMVYLGVDAEGKRVKLNLLEKKQ